MADEVDFLELACLLKVTQNTVLEKFGSSINASIYDASNIAGSLKQHGLIDFTAYYPGPNEIMVTETGKKLIAEADTKSTETYDKLDEAILAQLSGGKRVPLELQDTLNIRPRDLALRLYKLSKQGFIIYELKSGRVEILLTEAGFLKAGATPPAQKPRPMLTPQPGAAAPVQPMETPAMAQPTVGVPSQLQQRQQQTQTQNDEVKLHGKPLFKSPMTLVVVVIAVIVIIALYAHFSLNLI